MSKIAQKTMARPYAQAAFEWALEHQQLDAWSRFFTEAAELGDYSNIKKMIYYVQDKHQEELFQAIFPNATKVIHHFLIILTRYKRLELLHLMADVFDEFYHEYRQSIPVTLTSAYALTQPQVMRIKKVLKNRFQKNIDPECLVDPSILGGLTIQLKGLMLDGSALGRLKRLQHYLKGHSYADQTCGN